MSQHRHCFSVASVSVCLALLQPKACVMQALEIFILVMKYLVEKENTVSEGLEHFKIV